MATASAPASTSATSEMNTAFFYGTLMHPAILYRVVFGTHSITPPSHANITQTPAILPNYIRHRVLDCDYPGIVPCVEKSVRGVYVTGLTAQDIRRLDFFEGPQYDRRVVEIKLLKDGKGDEKEIETVLTETYVFLDKSDLEDKEWDFEEFKREKLMNWVGLDHEYAALISRRQEVNEKENLKKELNATEVDEAEADSTSNSNLSASKSSSTFENHDVSSKHGVNNSSKSRDSAGL